MKERKKERSRQKSKLARKNESADRCSVQPQTSDTIFKNKTGLEATYFSGVGCAQISLYNFYTFYPTFIRLAVRNIPFPAIFVSVHTHTLRMLTFSTLPASKLCMNGLSSPAAGGDGALRQKSLQKLAAADVFNRDRGVLNVVWQIKVADKCRSKRDDSLARCWAKRKPNKNH